MQHNVITGRDDGIGRALVEGWVQMEMHVQIVDGQA